MEKQINELRINIFNINNQLQQIKEQLEKGGINEDKKQELEAQKQQLENKINTNIEEYSKLCDVFKKQTGVTEIKDREFNKNQNINKPTNKKEQDNNTKAKDTQEADRAIVDVYDKDIEKIRKLDERIDWSERMINEYKKEITELQKNELSNKNRIEELEKKIQNLGQNMKELKNEKDKIKLQTDSVKSRVTLIKLREEKEEKEKEEKEKEEELKKHKTVEDIDKDIAKTEEKYKQKQNKLEDINSIEDKEKEVEELKEKKNKQIQTLISSEVISIQQQLLQNPELAGLKQIVKIESVVMPQLQPPTISVGQGMAQNIKMNNNL